MCPKTFDDEYRSTICPHDTFAANDGRNNFAHHPESYLGDRETEQRLYDHTLSAARRLRDAGDSDPLCLRHGAEIDARMAKRVAARLLLDFGLEVMVVP